MNIPLTHHSLQLITCIVSSS